MDSASLEPAIAELCAASLQGAIRKAAARILDGPGTLEVVQYRQVERLMRIAIELASGRLPHVQVHGLPPAGGTRGLPELFEVKLTNLLAARAAESLADALQGNEEAIQNLEREAGRILETEDIQLI